MVLAGRIRQKIAFGLRFLGAVRRCGFVRRLWAFTSLPSCVDCSARQRVRGFASKPRGTENLGVRLGCPRERELVELPGWSMCLLERG